MARDPEDFRGLSSPQIRALLLSDEIASQHTKARACGAKCVSCLDTGMNGGVFCGCSAGAKIAYQSSGAR